MPATNGAMESVSVDGVTQVQVMIMQTSQHLTFDIPRFLIFLVSFILIGKMKCVSSGAYLYCPLNFFLQ